MCWNDSLALALVLLHVVSQVSQLFRRDPQCFGGVLAYGWHHLIVDIGDYVRGFFFQMFRGLFYLTVKVIHGNSQLREPSLFRAQTMGSMQRHRSLYSHTTRKG